MKPFFNRAVLTTLLFVGFKSDIKGIPLLITLIILADNFDSPFKNSREYFKSIEYQKNDKIVDVLTYMLILILYSHLFSKKTYILMWIALIYRSIGVYFFYHSHNNKYIHYYPDLIKELMLLDFLCHKLPVFKNYYSVFVIIILFVKIQYEKFHHRNKYNNKIISSI
jgi:hypothetical protein